MSGNRGEKSSPRLSWFYAITVLIVIADQLTKYFAVHALQEGQSIPVLPGFFHLTLVFNTGIAFGMFQKFDTLLFILITLSIGLLAVFGFQIAGRGIWQRLSMAFILGGAAGNWIDRFTRGAVIDFFDFLIWPVFNVADIAIFLGVCFYGWLILFHPGKESCATR